MRELAPGVHMLGAKKGGRVRAYLIETDGELWLVDTLFENDAGGVLEAIRKPRAGRGPRLRCWPVGTHPPKPSGWRPRTMAS